MRIRTALACLVTLCLSPFTLAQDVFTYQNDSRRCSASFGGNGGGSAFDEPETPYGIFQGGANLEVFNGLENWAAHSDQMSSMDSTHMFMMSGASGSLLTLVDSAISAQGSALFDVWFTTSVEAPIHFCACLGESGYTTSAARVTLSTWAGAIILNEVSPDNASRTIMQDFVLPAGNYRMVGEALARVRIPPGITVDASAMCSFLLEVSHPESCRADVNGDGVVNSADFFQFLTGFLNGDADFDKDGQTGSEDFFGFMREYMGGCP